MSDIDKACVENVEDYIMQAYKMFRPTGCHKTVSDVLNIGSDRLTKELIEVAKLLQKEWHANNGVNVYAIKDRAIC